MAATTDDATTTATIAEETVSLADCDPTLEVPGTATAHCRFIEHKTGYELVVEREHTWIIEGSALTATLTGVYSDGGPVSKPQTMPRWLSAVCASFEIDEVEV